MYTKAESLRQFLSPDYAERLADVLYEIGKSLSSRSDFEIAIKWFERANEVINSPGLEQLSREGIELRLAILQALVTALLGAGTPEGLERAKNYVNFIEAEAGNKFVVSLLKLELLQKTPAEVFDSEPYADVLRYIIRNFTFSDSGFKLIMHHIRKLHDKSPGAGCAVLDDFILALSGAEKDGWMEKAVVTRMWMITNQRDSVETTTAAHDVLGHLSRPLSADAAVAAQAVGDLQPLRRSELIFCSCSGRSSNRATARGSMTWRRAGVTWRCIPFSRTAALGIHPSWRGMYLVPCSEKETDSGKKVALVCSCKKQPGCRSVNYPQNVSAKLERTHDSLSGLQSRHSH